GLPRAQRFQKDGWKEHMDRYRGAGIGVIVQCEKGYVLVPNYTEAIAIANDGHEINHWGKGDSETNHHENWLKAIAAGDRKRLNADILEGHLSSALCHAGNVSYRLGEKKPTAEIAEALAATEFLGT